MKKSLLSFLAFVVFAAALVGLVSCKKKDSGMPDGKTKPVKIGISKIISHPALDAVEKGIKDYLEEHEIKANIDTQNANGEVSASALIAQKFKDDKKHIVVGISTPTSQSLAAVFPEKSNVPVIFAAVTDPVKARLLHSWQGSEEINVCGVSDMTPVEEQIEIFAKMTGAKTIGNVYASGEANSSVLKSMIEDACEKLGLKLITTSISNSSEVKDACQSIADRIDAMYIAPDNTVISALAAVSDVMKAKKLPLFVADPSNFSQIESLIAWGFDYYSIGLEVGSIIEKIIGGQKSGTLGAVKLTDPSKFELHINLDNAKKLKIKVPEDIIKNAKTIIENGTIKENS